MAATQHAIDLARAAAVAAEDKLATRIVALDVSEQLALTDIFVLASAPNDRQVNAIVDGVECLLSAREFALLQALMLRPGAVLSRAQLEQSIYG